jgi:hypothetical protein
MARAAQHDNARAAARTLDAVTFAGQNLVVDCHQLPARHHHAATVVLDPTVMFMRFIRRHRARRERCCVIGSCRHPGGGRLSAR